MLFETPATPLRSIAVIGAGISGMAAAHLLAPDHKVVLFEAAASLGGHAVTVMAGKRGDQPVDMGFIVFNKKTYPNFCALLETLNVPIQLSEMSFSYHSKNSAFEYNGHSLNTLFSDRRNLFKPSFYRFIKKNDSFIKLR